MVPLAFETMMIIPLIEPRRLKLQGTHDIVHLVSVCSVGKYHMRNSPIEVRDYYLKTIGLDGVE